MIDLDYILADSDGGAGKFIVFGIMIAIWIIGAIVSSIGKAMKKTPEQTQPAPDWGDGQIVIRPEDYQQTPPPIAVPPPMPRQSSQQSQQQRGQTKQRQKQQRQKQQQQRPPKLPRQAAAQAVQLELPEIGLPPPRAKQAATANTVAGNVRMLLQPGSVREAYVLSEILGKPKGME
jgi:hypothetical protein